MNWEERYRTGDIPWDKGEPAPGLADFLHAHPHLPRSAQVCVPGCGTGNDVRAWARAGFPAAGCDLAPGAIAAAAARSEELGIPARYFTADFLHDSPPVRFDWLFEHTLFCTIHPSERDAYVTAVARWIAPGGNFLAVHYLIPDTDGPPFGTTRDEVWQRFSRRFELLAEWTPRSYPNRTGLERMFWWRAR